MKKILIGSAIASLLTLAAYAADAPSIWGDNCAKCHGQDGKGQTKMGHRLSIKDFTDPAVQAGFTDADGFKAVKEGIADKNGKIRMKAIEDLSDDEIRMMVQYVRSLKK